MFFIQNTSDLIELIIAIQKLYKAFNPGEVNILIKWHACGHSWLQLSSSFLASI